VGDRKSPVFEAGIANLTQRQTTMLVHRDGGAVEQLLLVKVDDVPGFAAPDVLDGGQAALERAAKPSPGDIRVNAQGDVIGREP
jgi:hypothetical protein